MRTIIKYSLIILIFLNCSIDLPDDPKAPIWDVKITRLPLFKADTLRIGDELKPDDFKRVGMDSILFISVGDTLNFSLEDKMTIPGQHQSYQDKLGDLAVDIDYSANQFVGFTELYPQYAGSVGQKIVVPPSDLVPISKDFTFNEFMSLSITAGGIRIEIENDLGFVLGNDVKLDLLDRGHGNQLIETIDLGRIETGMTDVFTVNLEGKLISSQLTTRIYGSLIGSEGQEVEISTNSGFSIRIGPDYLKVDSAIAKFPAQSLSADLSGEIDINSDSLRIDYATIKSGYIQFDVNNESELPLTIEFTIPNITRDGAEVLTLVYELNPQYFQDFRISLDRLKLDLVENENIIIRTKLYFHPEAETFYTLKSNDFLKLDVTFSDIEIQDITADIDLHTKFPQFSEVIFDDPPQQLDNLDFNDVIFRLSFPASEFNLDLNLEITAFRDGTAKTLVISHVLEKGETLVLSKDGVNYNGETPTLKDIINIIPERLTIRGIIGVQAEGVTFDRDDIFPMIYKIDVPLMFSLMSATYSDYDSLDIDDEARDDIGNYLLEASLEVTVENGIPVSGRLLTFIGSDIMNINTMFFSVDLPRPVLSSGIVLEPGISVITFDLSEEKIDALSEACYYRYQFMLDNSTLSTLTAHDYVIVRDVFITGKFRIDPEGFSEED